MADTTKKDCEKCKYHGNMAGALERNNKGPKGKMLTCDYILITGHMRPCPARQCTVYEKGRRRQGKDTIKSGAVSY